MSATVLVVCTANQCRSPVGAALLTELATRQLGNGAWTVTSAGTDAQLGMPVAEQAGRIARRWGQDLSGHRARQLDRDMIAAADLIVTMEPQHLDRVIQLVPNAMRRSYAWLELARLADHADMPADPAGSAQERIQHATRALHRARPLAMPPGQDGDIVADPMGRRRKNFQRMAATLVAAAEDFLPLLMIGRTGA